MLDLVRHMVADGPVPVAPFHHAVTAGEFMFVTGQMPTIPDDPTTLVDGGIEAQTHQVMQNLKRVLSGLDSDLERVVHARIYLTHFQDDYAAMNAVYESYFTPQTLPARTTIGVTGLAVNARVEIDLIVAR